MGKGMYGKGGGMKMGKTGGGKKGAIATPASIKSTVPGKLKK